MPQKLGGSGRPTHLAPRGALALKPYLRTLNAELATLEGITPKLQVINQAEMDQVRLGWESGCVWGGSLLTLVEG